MILATAFLLLLLLCTGQAVPSIHQTSTSTSVFAVCPFSESREAVGRYGRCDACKEAIRDGHRSASTICAESNCCARTFIGLTSHFFTCNEGCCTRLVTLQAAPDSDTAQIGAVLQMQTIVNNEITLKNITNGVCFFEDGPNQKCGTRCANQFFDEALCKGRKSAHVPVWGASMLNPPCSGLYPDVDPPVVPPSNPDAADPATQPTDSTTSSGTEVDDGTADDPPGIDPGTDEAPADEVFNGGSDGGATDDETTDDDSTPDKDDAVSNSDQGDPPSSQPITSDGDQSGTDESSQEGGSTDDPLGIASAGNSQSSQDDAACFPGDAVVTLENGSHIRMHQLRVGQRVLVSNGIYSTVFAFSHARTGGLSHFVRITMEKGHVVRASPGHFLYVNGVTISARDVRMGDVLILGSGGYDRVARVEWSEGTGLYNPQTIHGDIVVDGVVSTTYTEAIDLGTAHSLMAPLRAIVQADFADVVTPKVSKIIMNLSEMWRQYTTP